VEFFLENQHWFIVSLIFAESHFPTLINALGDSGWAVIQDFFKTNEYQQLFDRAVNLKSDYVPATIGRGGEQQKNSSVRTDGLFWLDENNVIDRKWLGLMEQLRLEINKHLFLGLFEYESHYACFEPGSSYQRHVDAFRGKDSRIVSVVFYLNPNWQAVDGGELVIYPDTVSEGIRFLPKGGTLAVFLSDQFPHEVLCSARTRYSIAGWFRVNGSSSSRLDPLT